MSLFERKSPAREDLLSLAAADYRAATAKAEQLQQEFTEWRNRPPALKDCLSILGRHAERRRDEFNEVLDTRLACLFDADFDEESGFAESLDLARLLGPNPLGQTLYHASAWGLWSDRLLEVAEERLKALGCGKGPTLAAKRAKLAEIQAEMTAIQAARDDSLATWRRLAGQPAGYP